MNTIIIRISFIAAVLVAAVCAASAQPTPKPSPVRAPLNGSVSTAAYAEVALRRAEFEAELESLLVDYTEEFPRVRELRFGLARLIAESERLIAIKPTDREKATVALGKLIVRKVELEVDLWKLQQAYADEHPEVRRAKKKVEIFEKAIKQILG
ncbi:MAG TPA: hypothetical protein VFZ49_03435 [Pyrinomonadaceae bacterium]